MRFATLGAAVVFCSLSMGQVPITIRVSDETAPPGGMAQLKVLITSPQPISSGTTQASFESAFFGDISGIALFSASGNVSGAAVVENRRMNLRMFSPDGVYGTTPDYPVLTIAVPITRDALPGQSAVIAPSFQLMDTSGNPIPLEVRAGSVTVGGSVAINNVVPGGSIVPAGNPVRLLGVGFTARTDVKVSEAIIDSQTFIGPNEIQLTFRQTLSMNGRMIRVKNPDGFSTTYYSYLRGVPAGTSANSLIANTVPIFPANPLLEGILPPTVSPSNPGYVTAVAVQNPGQSNADVRFELYDGQRTLVAALSLSIAPGMRFARELSELFGVAPQTGGFVRMVASAPVQMMGLLGNQADRSVQPVAITAIR